jgi:hypothetical protein
VPESERAQLDAYRWFLTRRLQRFESMLRGLGEAEHVFPQLVLRRAIARVRTSLSWADEVDGMIGEARGGRYAMDTSGTPRQPAPDLAARE